MNDFLIDAIIDCDEKIINKLFHRRFRNPTQWRDYLNARFNRNGSLSIDNILNNTLPLWGEIGFQALYIACWIHQPVEKGSFMIRLNDKQYSIANNMAQMLGKRSSSHLRGQSYSACKKNFDFIKGYDELLVIIPEISQKCIFLKMEGEQSHRILHAIGWIKKSIFDSGLTNNKYLNKMAGDSSSLGIKARQAENYNSGYEDLLKALGYTRKTVNFNEMYQTLRWCEDLKQFCCFAGSKKEYFNQVFKFAEIKCKESFVFRHSSVNFLNVGKIFKPLLNAKKDIMIMLEDFNVRSSEHNFNNDIAINAITEEQIFHEIWLNPQEIDDSLNKFSNKLQTIGSRRSAVSESTRPRSSAVSKINRNI